MARDLEIRLAGGMPPALGGGGMELQMQRTAEALRRLGHGVARIEAEPAGARFDVLHAFHAEAWLTHGSSTLEARPYAPGGLARADDPAGA